MTDLPTSCSLSPGSCIRHATTTEDLEGELLHCPPHSALLVLRVPLLSPPMGTGSGGAGCVFMCITCSGTGGCTGATLPSLQINVQAVPGWAESSTSEFSSPCWLPFSKGSKAKKLFLPRLVVGEGKVSTREKNTVKYSQLLFWQMATLAFWTLMGKTNVLSVKKQIAKNKTVIYLFFNFFLLIFLIRRLIYYTCLRHNTCV